MLTCHLQIYIKMYKKQTKIKTILSRERESGQLGVWTKTELPFLVLSAILLIIAKKALLCEKFAVIVYVLKFIFR